MAKEPPLPIPGLDDAAEPQMTKKERRRRVKEARRLEKKRQKAELAKISKEMRTGLRRNSIVWVGICAIFMILAMIGGYYFWCFYRVNLWQKRFDETYKISDIETLKRFAPQQMKGVENYRLQAKRGSTILETKKVIKNYKEAHLLLHEARETAAHGQEKYREVRHEFNKLYEEAEKKNLGKYAPEIWKKIEACNPESGEGREAFLSEDAIEKMTAGIEQLKAAQESFGDIRTFDESAETYKNARKVVVEQEWERNLVGELARVQSTETRAVTAAENNDWPTATQLYQSATAIIKDGLASLSKTRGEAHREAKRFNEALSLTNPRELAAGDKQAWSQVQQFKKTVADAIKAYDYALATATAKKGIAFLEEKLGDMEQRRAERDKTLAELNSKMKEAEANAVFLRKNSPREWGEIKLAYSDIQSAAKLGEHVGLAEKAKALSERLGELMATGDTLIKGLSKSKATCDELMADPRNEMVALNFPQAWQEISFQYSSAKRHDQRKKLKEAYKRYTEVSKLLAKAQADLDKLEKTTALLAEQCAKRRESYALGIQHFRKAAIPKMQQLDRRAKAYAQSKNYSLALPLYKELAQLLPDARFTFERKGTTIDNVTGLMWVRDGNGKGCNGGAPMNWYDAYKWTASLEFAGYTDWAIPSDEELQNLSQLSPTELNAAFPNMGKAVYWTRIPASDVDKALAVDMGEKQVVLRGKREALMLHPVRTSE